MRISDWSSDVCSSDLATSTATGSGTPGGSATVDPSDPYANIKRGGVMQESDASDPPAINPYASASFLAKGVSAYVYSRFYKIGRASWREKCVSTCRSRWSPYH